MASVASPLPISIVFHGNCVDGWMSAYIAYSFYITEGRTITLYPISPSVEHTWPSQDFIRNTSVILLDISLPEEELKIWENISASVFCIDHHSTSASQWNASEERKARSVHSSEACATVLTWKYFYYSLPLPEWALQIDRFDRWKSPTYDDRCIREYLMPIARLPTLGRVQEALTATADFICLYSLPSARILLLQQGASALASKQAALNAIVDKGIVVSITQDQVDLWKLPEKWIGKQVFVVDTTNSVLDSTEASQTAFERHPTATIFINWRKKIYHNNAAIIYSARAREGEDLTDGGVFAGHPTSAGGKRIVGEDITPFI